MISPLVLRVTAVVGGDDKQVLSLSRSRRHDRCSSNSLRAAQMVVVAMAVKGIEIAEVA